MKLIKFFSPKKKRAQKLPELTSWYSATSAAGKSVTFDTSLQVAAVWACVRVLAETLASLPCLVYRRLPNGGKERLLEHPAARLLKLKPNSYQTSVSFFEQMQAQCVLRGNTYAQKIYSGKNEIKELVPLDADRIEPELTSSAQMVYKVRRKTGGFDILTAEDILHVPALIMSGVKGKSVLDVARESIGHSMAADEHGARFFGNGAMPIAVLEHPSVLSQSSLENIKKSFFAEHGGVSNSNKMAILEEGLKLNAVSFSPEQSQFIESRRFQVVEICRWFRMQPHMIGHLDNATYTNIEQQSLEFVTYTLRPWLVRWEKALTAALFSEEEQDELYIEFLVDGLLRGDTFTRFQAYKLAIDGGWMNRDEVRELENRSPIPNGEGQEFMLTPPGATDVNQAPAPTTEEPKPKEEKPSEAEAKAADLALQVRSARLCDILATWEPMTKELLMRAIRKSNKQLQRAQTAGGQQTFLATFTDAHREDFDVVLTPVLESFNRQIHTTTNFMTVPATELFKRWWANALVEVRTLAKDGEDAFYTRCVQNLEAVIVGAYLRKEQPPAPIVNVQIDPIPVDVDVKVKMEQPATITRELVLRKDATGAPIGAKITDTVN